MVLILPAAAADILADRRGAVMNVWAVRGARVRRWYIAPPWGAGTELDVVLESRYGMCSCVRDTYPACLVQRDQSDTTPGDGVATLRHGRT